jgi:hypothetical protein
MGWLILVSRPASSFTSQHIHPRRQALHELFVPSFEVVHILQNGHALISSEWVHVVQIVAIKLIQNLVPPLRIAEFSPLFQSLPD